MITDFPVAPLANMAGNKSFLFSPYQHIAVLPTASNDILSVQLQFTGNNNWLAGYSTINELDYNEDSATDEGGTIYSVDVTGFVPGTSPQLQTLMKEMERCRHIVAVNDHSNNVKIAGYQSPLQFNAIYGSGKVAGADAKGYRFRFFTQTHIRPPFLVV